MDRPLIVISPGRSGSSWTAGKLARAGVFGGHMRPGDRWNEDGYFENIALHKALRDWYGSDWVRGPFPEEHPDWHFFVSDTLESEGYQ